MNCIKYCVKCRALTFEWKRWSMPPVAVLLTELFDSLPHPLDLKGELYRKWQIFN